VKSQYTRFAVFAACGCALFSCSKNRETVSSQTQRNWVEADQAALSSAKLEPEANILPNTYLAAGRLHEMQGAYDKAIEQYQLAIAGEPKNVGAMNRLAMVYTRLGRFADAQRALKRAVEIQPDAAQLRNNLGYAYICERKWTEAETEFRMALRSDPGFKRAHINLGLALARQERINEALSAFREVLPEPDALYNLGLVLRGMQRYQEAADAFALALEHNQQFVAAQRQLEQLAPRLKTAASRNAQLGGGQEPNIRVAALAGNTASGPEGASAMKPSTTPSSDAEVKGSVAAWNPTGETDGAVVDATHDGRQPVHTPAATADAETPAIAVDPGTRGKTREIEREAIPVAEVIEEAPAVQSVVEPVKQVSQAGEAPSGDSAMVIAEAPMTITYAGVANENAREPIVEIHDGITSDVAPLITALEDEAVRATEDGLTIRIQSEGAAPNAVQPAKLAPPQVIEAAGQDDVREIHIEALTGSDQAIVDRADGAIAAEPMAQAVPIMESKPADVSDTMGSARSPGAHPCALIPIAQNAFFPYLVCDEVSAKP